MIQILRNFFAPAADDRSLLFSDFRHALARETLLTERLRVWTVIVTVVLLASALALADAIVPDVFVRMSDGRFDPTMLYAICVPFVLFELSVVHLLGRRIALHQDVPVVRRYIGVLIEASLPTASLYLHMNWLGPSQALAFAAPLTYFLFIILSTLRMDFWLSTFTGLVSGIGLFGMAVLYHPAEFAAEPAIDPAFQLIRSLILLTGGILAGAVGLQLRRQFESSIAAATARDRVTNLFGQHVSPQVVERLLASGAEVTGEIRHVAVMFVDFRNFTAAARLRTPHQVVARLDGAFAVLVDALDRHSGIVNKFLGDGFLALFGAPIADPDAAQRAVAAARDMLAAMEENNSDSDWPLRIGIGVHMGAVVAGNVGSPRRKEYTVIGDTVNFAARLESLNKQFGSQLLISADVRDALGMACDDALHLGEVPIRGYDQPQAIWKLG
jgi:adenylate cyclase